jgi:hypothetical protein
MNYATRHKLESLTRIINDPSSTPAEVAGARTEIRKLQGEPSPKPAAPSTEFETNAFFEEILAAGPYVGVQYLDLFGNPDQPATWTALARYCRRSAGHSVLD